MNRVLFKAAALVNIAAAALIYVACSGDDGKDGPPGPAGAACTVEASATVAGGVDVICGGVRQTLNPGTPGAAGAPGAPGQNGQGVPEDGCYLSATAAGYNVICGGVDQGPLSTGGGPGGGCLITANTGSAWIDINCGTGNQIQLAKAICNYTPVAPSPNAGIPQAEAYDYATEVCNSVSGIQGNCNGAGFDRNNRFCTGDNKILARCGAKFFAADAGDNAGKMKPDSTGVYDPATQFCLKKDGTGASLFYAEGTGTDQLGGSLNLDQGEVTAKCFTTASNEYTTAKATNAGDVTQYNAGNYSINDFCSAAKIYPKCSASGVFAPTTSFCLIPSTITSIKLGAVTGGQVKDRCGTTAVSGNIPSTNYVVSGPGTYFSDRHFCSGTGATSKINMLCKGYASSAATNPTLGTGITTILTDGTYKPESEYCKLTNTATAGEYGASIEVLASCSGAPNVKYDDGTQFCVNGVVYPLCGKGGSTDKGGTTRQLDPTKQFCDERGILSPNANTAAIAATNTNQITSAGGTVYDFVSIGTQSWMAEDLTYVPTGVTPTTAGVYDWATAMSAETGCPAGWSLPTDVQLNGLIAAVNTASGASTPALLMRVNNTVNAALTDKWTAFPADGSESGFNAIPFSSAQQTALSPAFIISLDLDATPGANGIPPISTTALSGSNAGWWTKDEDAANAVVGSDKNNAIFRWFKDTDVVVRKGSGSKLANKLLVRCVK